MRHEHHSKLIDELGGTSKVSELCEVSSQAVSKWRKNGIPPARLMYLRLIRKDVFSKHEETLVIDKSNKRQACIANQ